eukprot:UN1539
MEVVGWVALLYWAADIAVTFNTGGFKKGGYLIMDRRQIAWMYLCKWFLPDALLVIIELAVRIQTTVSEDPSSVVDGAGAMRAGKFMKTGRLLRLLRLLRIAKLKEMTFMLQHLMDSEWMTIAFMVSKNLMSIMALNHLLACIWFLVGSASGAQKSRHQRRALEVFQFAGRRVQSSGQVCVRLLLTLCRTRF